MELNIHAPYTSSNRGDRAQRISTFCTSYLEIL